MEVVALVTTIITTPTTTTSGLNFTIRGNQNGTVVTTIIPIRAQLNDRKRLLDRPPATVDTRRTVVHAPLTTMTFESPADPAVYRSGPTAAAEPPGFFVFAQVGQTASSIDFLH